MMQPTLDLIDREFIKQNLRQVVLAYIGSLVVIIPIYFIGFMVFRSIFSENEIPVVIYTLFVFGLYVYFFYRHLKPSWNDLKSNTKNIELGMVQEKYNDTRYASSGNSVGNPKLIEYFVMVNGTKYFIPETDFDKLVVDDSVELHFTAYTNRLIRIKKVDKSEKTDISRDLRISSLQINENRRSPL